MFPPPQPLGRERGTDADSAIRQTDTDAALARLSAVKKGYIEDPFIALLLPRAQFQPARPPLINIGTYVRSESIDALVEQWLGFCEQQDTVCQIVSLGAGSDTRFWRINVRASYLISLRADDSGLSIDWAPLACPEIIL